MKNSYTRKETEEIIRERISHISTQIVTETKQSEMNTAYALWIEKLTEFATEQWVKNLNNNAIEARTLFEATHFTEPEKINESEFSLPFFFFDALDITGFLATSSEERLEALNLLTEELATRFTPPKSN